MAVCFHPMEAPVMHSGREDDSRLSKQEGNLAMGGGSLFKPTFQPFVKDRPEGDESTMIFSRAEVDVPADRLVDGLK